MNGFVSEKVGYLQMLLLLSLGAVILFSLIFVVWAVGLSIVLFVLLGFFFSGIYPTVMAQAGSVFPQYSGTVSGVLTASGGLGGMFLPLSMGLVSDYAGLGVGLFVSLVATIVMFVIAVVSFQYLKRVNILKSSG
ncbi:MAG: MFS transporter [Candidatus Caldatribacteriaceae bacterium]